MMKRSFSLAAIISVAALSSGALFASVNPAQACILSKNSGAVTKRSDNPSAPASMQLNPIKMGIVGAGIAAAAGLVAVGMAYKARRTGQQSDTVVAEVPQEEVLDATSFPIPVPPEALGASTSEQETANSTADKDLTLVG